MYIKMNLMWGPIVIGINEKAQIFGLWFHGQKYFPVMDQEALLITVDDTKTGDLSEKYVDNSDLNTVICTTISQLREYEDGRRKVFDLPLDPEGTKYRHKVWKILTSIPYGETQTYGQISNVLATEMNKTSMSAQAVGGAVGHNPISIIIPCHRVIGSDGSLTGYAGGLSKKKALLAHEEKYKH